MATRYEREMSKHPWNKESSKVPTSFVLEPEQASQAVLERQAIVPANDEDLRVGLARKAEALLGYSVLRKDARVPGALAAALLKLGIEPYSDESVEAYKRKMLTTAKRNNPKATVRMETAKLRKTAPQNDGLWGGSVLRMDMMQNVWFTADRSTYTEIAWTESNLRGYEKPIPEFVLSRAVEIKNECPGAEFFVDELKEQQRTIDPFLIVKFKDEAFYIDVWDEPEFEKAIE